MCENVIKDVLSCLINYDYVLVINLKLAKFISLLDTNKCMNRSSFLENSSYCFALNVFDFNQLVKKVFENEEGWNL